ncbi:PadR family transcriptional regulator [Cytobacillus sp.]|uniref:PadR family transcriptional regulator n=1 Tax=Cytobacillus sp. TaxID=2675269 RepID=UPI0028BE69B6|nr:PadR family transcriptional regulator [Cytobacillus sp.]
MRDTNEHLDKLMQELRRGTLTIGVLSQLYEPQYGYSLVSLLEGKGFPVEAGTLYPLLRRLEKQGLLESQWDTNETRPRKYYLLSESGKLVFDQLVAEWEDMVGNLDNLLKSKGGL